MKDIIFIIMLLLCTMSVVASSPDFEVSYRLNDSLRNGENQLGKIVLIPTTPISDVITLSEIQNVSIDKYDQILWRYTKTLEVGYSNAKSLLFFNELYSFNQKGTYTLNYIDNITNKRYVHVGDMPDNIVNFEYTVSNDGLEVCSGQQTNINLDSEQDFNLDCDVNINILPDDYTLNIRSYSDYKNVTKDMILNLPQDKSWSVFNSNIESEIDVKSGDYKELGQITLTNDGNINFNLYSDITGNASDFVVINDNQTILKNMNTAFSVILHVPINKKVGYYHSVINIYDNTKSEIFEFGINVKDNFPPEITHFGISRKEVKVNNTVHIMAKDNMNVTNATFKAVHEYIEGNLTKHYIIEEDLIPTDINYFEKNIIFDMVGDYKISYCVQDSSSNSDCDNTTIDVTKYDPFTNFTKINFGSKKSDSFNKKILFNITENLKDPIKVRINDFTTDVENDSMTDYVIKLISEDVDEDFYNWTEITKKGIYYIKIKSDVEIDYEGTIDFDMPDYMKDYSDYSFSGKFISYNVPEAGNYETPNGFNYTIEVVDTGEYSTSKTKVIINYPIDIAVEDLGMVTTQGAMEETQEKYDLIVENVEEKIKNYKRGLILSIISAILLIMYATYMIRIDVYYRGRKFK